MKPLSRESKRLIDEVRAGEAPSHGAELRNWQSLATKLNAPLPPTAAAVHASLSAKTATGFLAGVTGKLVVGVTIAAALGGGGVYASREWRRTSEPSRGAAAARASQLAAAKPNTPPLDHTNPNVAEAPSSSIGDAPGRPNPTRVVHAAELQPTQAAAQPQLTLDARLTSVSSLREEAQLIELAHKALAEGEPARALTLLARHSVRFPNGTLTEERAAARILSLCALGRVSAAASERAAFESRWPASMLAERVRLACEPPR